MKPVANIMQTHNEQCSTRQQWKSRSQGARKPGWRFSIMGLYIILIPLVLSACTFGGAKPMLFSGEALGDSISIGIDSGAHWKHTMILMGFIPLKNRPQIAIWVEDMNGNFLHNIYVTHKSATQSWAKGPGDPTPKDQIHRYESLPYWMYRQNREFEPGILMPTRKQPLPGMYTSATPKRSFVMHSTLQNPGNMCRILIEVNHSTDFNSYFNKDANPGEPAYSGGGWGSGQPSVVYEAILDKSISSKSQTFKLIGHGSPDGSSGELFPITDKLDTALDIIAKATLERR